MINNIFTIDAHCHIYPEKIASRAVVGTDTFYGEKSLCKGTAEDLILEGQKAGIDHFIVQSVATSPHQVKSINEFIAEEVSVVLIKGVDRYDGEDHHHHRKDHKQQEQDRL